MRSASLRSHVALDREVRVHAFERRGIVFDSALTAIAVPERRDVALYFLVLEGTIEWSGESSGRARAPFFLRMREDLFEGARGRRTHRFVNRDAFRGIEIAVRARHHPGPLPARPEMVPLPPAVIEATDRYLRSALPDHGAPAADHAEASALLEALAEAGLVAPTAAESLVAVEAPRLLHVWSVLSRAYHDFDTDPSLKTVASAAALSLRQLTRVSSAIGEDLLVKPGGFRSVTMNLRLILATMFLTAADLSVSDVARLVGYGHPQAMANAFKRQGLPPPSRVKEEACAA